MVFHVHQVENYLCEKYARNGRVSLEISTIFHVHEVKKCKWRILLHFMSKKWKSVTRELYNILCTPSGKL